MGCLVHPLWKSLLLPDEMVAREAMVWCMFLSTTSLSQNGNNNQYLLSTEKPKYKQTMARPYETTEYWPTTSTATSLGRPVTASAGTDSKWLELGQQLSASLALVPIPSWGLTRANQLCAPNQLGNHTGWFTASYPASGFPRPAASNWGWSFLFSHYKALPLLCLPLGICQAQWWWLTPWQYSTPWINNLCSSSAAGLGLRPSCLLCA